MGRHMVDGEVALGGIWAAPGAEGGIKVTHNAGTHITVASSGARGGAKRGGGVTLQRRKVVGLVQKVHKASTPLRPIHDLLQMHFGMPWPLPPEARRAASRRDSGPPSGTSSSA